MSDRAKVFWSAAERLAIVRRAADLHAADPRLRGLALLRAAIEVLPSDRHRSLIALSQAPWFGGMLQDELGRRALEERVTTDAAAAVREQMERMQTWSTGQLARLDRMLPSIERLGAPDRVEKIEGMIADNREILREVTGHHKAFISHYMETATLVIALLRTLIGHAQVTNTHLSQVATPHLERGTQHAAAPVVRRKDVEHDSQQY
jgi:hypothetical protein